MPRVIAIDWSGAVQGAARKIWFAEVVDGRVARLECGRSRAEVEAFLLDEAARDPRVITGLDFAFSMPAWFLRERGFASASALWAHVASGGGEECPAMLLQREDLEQRTGVAGEELGQRRAASSQRR